MAGRSLQATGALVMVRVGGFLRISLTLTSVLTGALAATSAAAEPGAKHIPWRAGSPPESAFTSPARFFSIREVLAKVDARRSGGSEENYAGAVQLASLGSPAAQESPAETTPQAGEPFGLLAFRAPEGTLWRKWRGLEAGLAAEANAIARCREDEDACSPAARRFLKIVEAVKDREGRDRIAEANRDINAAVRYVTDYAQFGELDRWVTPLATLASGRGDCEDYAIAKYAVLRYAGFAQADLRLVLVHDRAVRADHAVLAVRHGGKWLILDNRHSVIHEDMEQRNFAPLFALDQDGVKLFAAPYVGQPKLQSVKAPAPAPAPAAAVDGNAAESRATQVTEETGSSAWIGRPLLL